MDLRRILSHSEFGSLAFGSISGASATTDSADVEDDIFEESAAVSPEWIAEDICGTFSRMILGRLASDWVSSAAEDRWEGPICSSLLRLLEIGSAFIEAIFSRGKSDEPGG